MIQPSIVPVFHQNLTFNYCCIYVVAARGVDEVRNYRLSSVDRHHIGLLQIEENKVSSFAFLYATDFLLFPNRTSTIDGSHIENLLGTGDCRVPPVSLVSESTSLHCVEHVKAVVARRSISSKPHSDPCLPHLRQRCHATSRELHVGNRAVSDPNAPLSIQSDFRFCQPHRVCGQNSIA